MMLMKKLFVVVGVLGVGTVAVAQDYFDFGQIPGLPDRPAVQVDLDTMLLGLASATARSADPAVAELLSGLEGVRIRVYKTIEDVGDVVEYVDEASDQLERADWQQVVRVQDEGEVRVYVRGDGESLTGITAMIVGEGEAVFVNVAGSISSEQLAQVATTFGAGEILGSLGEIEGLN